MRVQLLLVGLASALASAGCAGAGLVSARAADDLRCPEKEISVKSRDMGGYEAQGCGRQASYMVRGGEVMPDDSSADDLPSTMPKGGE